MKIDNSGDAYVFAAPASYSQERLWFLDRLEPNKAIYNIPYIATVKGAVHRRAFNAALNRLIARQESLRTSFVEEQGQPRQVIHPRLEVEVDHEDLSRLDPRLVADRLQHICSEVTSRPFDLQAAPLFRTLLVSDGRETTIITTLHHIVSDGWSIGVFQRELIALYDEELSGRRASLPDLSVQYVDYAEWQRGQLQGDNFARLRDYWLRELDGAPTLLEIPGDYPRPAKQTFTGDVHLFEIDAECAAALRALGQRQDATLFMTLFAAFAVLLWRLTAQTDMLVGTPIAGRVNSELENLIGLFVNTLALRARIDPEMSFGDLVAQVRETTIGAFEHQELPFEKLVFELNPKRDLSHGPLVQILFSLQNIPPLQEIMAGVEQDAATTLNGHTATAKFDFALFASEVGDRLQCSIEYNTDLFAAETIVEIGDYFRTLLQNVAGDPNLPLHRYSLLDPEVRAYSLGLGTGRLRPAGEKLCHRMVERQARATPGAIAVSHVGEGGTEILSYDELNRLANRIARHLIAQGARVGGRIALCLPRGIAMVASVLAIAKTGSAYVPLDPDQPTERLRLILADLGDALVVTQPALAGKLGPEASIVDLAAESEAIEAQRDDGPALDLSPETPLYIIYTSGSTGRPKGVVMPHRAIANLVAWQAEADGFTPGSSTLQYAPLYFDVATQEIFSTLATGGRLELIDDATRRDSARLLDALGERAISRLFLPPVALEELAKAARGRAPGAHALAEVIVAGDKLQVTEHVRSFFAALPGARLVNHYGPSETHVVSAHVLSGSPEHWPSLPPIGRPIDMVQLYVLDENRQPVPTHVGGELYVGGAGVAQGYLNLAEETARRFVPDPFVTGGLLYRTGDICRWDRDGALHFVGRADGQIKLRGFRIEPAEIELALKTLPGIAEATVIKRANGRGEDELVAYFVAAETAGTERAKLRAYLGERLPLYMIPSRFVRLGAMPLTRSGKLDRLRLPDPADAGDLAESRTFVGPRTPIEQFLADAWRALLHRDAVSIDDNFFDLGGHSLTATQLVSRIRDGLGVELPLIEIFERPTIEQIALEIVQRQAVELERSALESMLAELESMSEAEIEQRLATVD